MKPKTSICDMNLSDAFISRIQSDIQKSIESQKYLDSGSLTASVVPIHTDRQTFIEGYLQNLYVSKQGIFCKQRSFVSKRKNHFIYDCERSCFSKGSSTGDPTKTRANGCKAFVSFTFEEGATINLCVIKCRLAHSGHNPANREECKVNRIDSVLKEEIQNWINETTKVPEILLKVSKWNKIHGNMDYKDRRYFPSPQDIQQFIWMSHKAKKVGPDIFGKALKRPNNATSSTDFLASMLKTKHKDMCVFYQPAITNVTNPKPMILVLQAHHQKEKYKMHGQNLIFISKNFEGLRSYGNVIYSLVVRDEDIAYPIAYIVSNSDDHKSFVQGLQKFSSNNLTVKPKAFFIDKDLIPCSDAITSLYPESKILVPKYQVMKAVHDWLMQSAVSEKGHRDVREVLLKYMLDLSNCGTADEFLLGTSELEQKVDYPEFTEMLKKEWLVCGVKWCDFGRSQLFTSTHNSFLVEKLFLNLEHQLLNCLQTLYRPEDLVEHIAKDLNQNKGDQDGLIDMEDFLEGTPEEQAENLLQDGWGRLVLWPTPFEAFIPNQSNPDLFYNVKLITMECECPFPPYRGLCVHLNLALMLSQKKAKEEGEESVEAARIRIALEAEENRDYLPERLSLTTFHSGIICVTSLSDLSCTCKASFFGFECVGVVLARNLNPNLTLTEPLPKPTVEYPKQLTISKEHHLTDPETMSAVNSLHSLSNQNFANNVHHIVPSFQSDKSSAKLIEDLFVWSQSPAFTDSPTLHSLLVKIHAENQISLLDEKPKERSPRIKKDNSPYHPQKRARNRTPVRESPRKSARTRHGYK